MVSLKLSYLNKIHFQPTFSSLRETSQELILLILVIQDFTNLECKAKEVQPQFLYYRFQSMIKYNALAFQTNHIQLSNQNLHLQFHKNLF